VTADPQSVRKNQEVKSADDYPETVQGAIRRTDNIERELLRQLTPPNPHDTHLLPRTHTPVDVNGEEASLDEDNH